MPDTTDLVAVRILREEGLVTTPRLIELRGACDGRGRYDLRISVFGRLRAKHLRNIIKQLDLQAAFLEEDETQEVESDNG